MRKGRVLVTVAVALLWGRALHAQSQARPPDGQALYREHCRTCHGVTGTPPQRAREQYDHIRTLSDSAFMAQRSDDSVMAVLRRGAGHDMKSFTGKMTPEEMRAVVAYVRTLAHRPPH